MISRIVTDDKKPGEAKDPDSTSLTQLFKAFSTDEEYAQFRAELTDGLGWGEAKKKLFNQIEAEIGPMRPKYEEYINEPQKLEEILLAGAEKARKISAPFLEELRNAVGLRPFTAFKGSAHNAPVKETKKKSAAASFKQYRNPDGTFGFKFTDAAGTVLLESTGWASGAEAGRAIGQLKKNGIAALAALPLVERAAGITDQQLADAFASLA